SHASPTINGKASVSPVIERVVQNNQETGLSLIDLDRNKVFARDLTKEFAQDPAHREAACLAWRNQQRQQGIDAVFWTLKETTEGLAGWDMRVVPVGPDD